MIDLGLGRRNFINRDGDRELQFEIMKTKYTEIFIYFMIWGMGINIFYFYSIGDMRNL